jgi:hypothetical protein
MAVSEAANAQHNVKHGPCFRFQQLIIKTDFAYV